MSQFEINKLLQACVDTGASDLHLAVGRAPVLRVSGRMRALNTPALKPDDTEALMKSITSERAQQELDEVGGTDFGFSFGTQARFRVAVFKQKGNVGVVLRQIPNDLLTFEQLGFGMKLDPNAGTTLEGKIKDMLNRPRGLVLVTGPTGSGKSTTLATMIDFINREMEHHIITVEDPVEFYHDHQKSVVTQREVGVDVSSFEEALRRALRQDPDVILVGEMRDLETISAAISAAETGHLVFGTLHTTGAARTVDRIIDAFPTNQQEMVRSQLSSGLVAVISQVLCRTTDGGRCAAYEIMINNPAIQNLIRENKTFRINSTIQTSRKEGMFMLDDYLFNLFAVQRKIDHKTMISKSQNPEDIEAKLKEMMAQRGTKKKKR